MLKLVRFLHSLYKRFASPLFGNSCRFHPPCSDYALEAIEKHGLLFGGWLAIKRIVKCQPYCEGGEDPVP